MNAEMSIRRLKASDNAAFSKLIRSGPVFAQSVLVPDHNLDFYKFISNDDPLFWGAALATQPQELIGVAGFGSIETNLPAQIRTFYQSDSYVLPKYRGQNCYPSLMRAHSDFFNSMNEIPASLAVENDWQGLSGLQVLLKRKKLNMQFTSTTTLLEVYLLGGIEEPSSSVDFTLLKDWPTYRRQNFIDAFQAANPNVMYMPVPSIDYIRRLESLDAGAGCFLFWKDGCFRAGLIAVDMSKVRVFRYSGKQSLLINAVQERRIRQGRKILQPGEPLRFLNLCFAWYQHEYCDDMQKVLHHAHYWAEQAGYDGVLVRDISERCIPEAIRQSVDGRWPNIMCYRRRSCLVMRESEKELMNQLLVTSSQWKWDSSIL